jgi:hypothetical protein
MESLTLLLIIIGVLMVTADLLSTRVLGDFEEHEGNPLTRGMGAWPSYAFALLLMVMLGVVTSAVSGVWFSVFTICQVALILLRVGIVAWNLHLR